MNRVLRNAAIAALAAAPFAAFVLKAHPTGADPRVTGAPGDDLKACSACHLGTALNGGPGGVKIILPGGNSYTPGVKQHIQVQVSDPSQRRWGFELTARLSSSAANGQAGDLASTDSFTQVVCDNGRSKPCASASTVQFATHTLAGTRLGTTGSATFDLDWTPPANDAGKITLYAAGNAANGDNRETGDRIYTTSVELSPAAVVPPPTITQDTGVMNAASRQPGIAQNSWVAVTGDNLSATTRTWTLDELASGAMPTALDGVSVTINGKPAYVAFVSPKQINVLAPADDALGPVEVRVTLDGQTSNAVSANLQAFAPAFFTADGKYLATTPGNNGMLDQSGLFYSSPDGSAPVKPGDTVVLYGTGFFGAADPVTLTIGGVPATVVSAGLAPGLPQIYQITAQVPDGLSGDRQVVAQVGGASSPAGDDCCYLKVQP